MAPKKKSQGMPNTRIGSVSKFMLTKESLTRNYYARRRLISVPQEIARANPDKHFCFVNMNKLQKNGMWHQQGYQLYRAPEDSGNQHKEKFNQALDPYIHRNELVLAYISQDEYEMRQLEREAVKGKRNLEDLIKRSPSLSRFSPTAKASTEIYADVPPSFKREGSESHNQSLSLGG